MSIVKTLQEIRDGAFLTQINEELVELVDAVGELRKGGSITIKLDLKPNGEDAITVSPSVAAKVPKPKVGDAVFFNNAGNLSRRNPAQMDIEDEVLSQRLKKEAE